MPLRPSFVRMRQRLIDRGLLDAEFRLTEAGNAYVVDLKAKIRRAEAELPPETSVVWRADFRAKSAELAQRRAA